ncbi:GNAT family N-acetyltransferase [Lactobacillus sp. LC28-10]|uniref:GNAT family N-acetyltransferase n=1 Tax=Secundilactobacillus angelensis TaxID=2722706 RepID=A0ABX1L0E6_9LACO|nr:GNAT family N-acetyltransferase [Secundilactobacillus angelensis]MCH5462003.1 GNAT family N-acetyltransferase [Secundilactobacillus angelensis]NLR18925.1 GNAT family N-acetyltransferase [Secundilactobacillus angelensis]
MKIREIKPADDAQMAKILRSSLEQLHLNLPGTAYFDPFVDHLSEWYQKTAVAKYFVAVTDADRVVGGCGVGPIAPEEGIAELQKLYVDPEYRQHGTARQLLPACFDYAKAHYQSLYLETFASMKPANELYQKVGFKQLSKPLPQSEHSACDTWYMKSL